MRPPRSPAIASRAVTPLALLLSFPVLLAVHGSSAGAQTVTAPTPDRPPSCADHVAEAAQRFGLPERWIGAVMHEESRGRPRAVSPAGALGCMQVMPATYAELRQRYRLGPDPFAVRDNVLAGSAYLREMYERYGGVGMLAAYNAGPKRWEDHLAGVRPLPPETVGYLARLGPVLNLGDIPAPTITAAPAAPSPFTAPIFVAWAGSQSAVETRRDRESVRQVVAANVPVVPTSGELFVRRSPVAEVPSIEQPASDRAAADRPPEKPQASDPPPRSSAPNGIFVPRASDGGDR